MITLLKIFIKEIVFCILLSVENVKNFFGESISMCFASKISEMKKKTNIFLSKVNIYIDMSRWRLMLRMHEL